MSLKPNIDVSIYKLDDEVKNSPIYNGTQTHKSHEQVKKDIKNYLSWLDSFSEKFHTFKHKPYKDEALAIAHLWIFNQATKEALKTFKKLTTFDFKSSTIIIKIFNYDDEVISYKRRRFNGKKWVSKKGTHPNSQCIMNISLNGYPVYIIEGHHDALTATLLGLNFIMIPTSSYKKFTDYELDALIGCDVFFLPDLPDPNSIKNMRILAEQIEDIANVTAVISLKAFLQSEKISHEGKLDLSEAVEYFSSIEYFTNALHCFSDSGNFYNSKEIF